MGNTQHTLGMVRSQHTASAERRPPQRAARAPCFKGSVNGEGQERPSHTSNSNDDKDRALPGGQRRAAVPFVSGLKIRFPFSFGCPARLEVVPFPVFCEHGFVECSSKNQQQVPGRAFVPVRNDKGCWCGVGLIVALKHCSAPKA